MVGIQGTFCALHGSYLESPLLVGHGWFDLEQHGERALDRIIGSPKSNPHQEWSWDRDLPVYAQWNRMVGGTSRGSPHCVPTINVARRLPGLREARVHCPCLLRHTCQSAC